MGLGERLKKARKNKGLTQAQLGKLLNVSDATINRYERGQRKPDPDMLRKLAEVLDVSVDYLVNGSTTSVPNETLAAHLQDDPLKDLPEVARRSIEQAVETLSYRLKLARRRKKLTQRQLAALINLSPSTIALYETGKREPDLDTLRKLADALDCTTDYLLGRTDPEDFNGTIAAHRTDDPLEELPEEARRSLEEFQEYILHKYGKKKD